MKKDWHRYVRAFMRKRINRNNKNRLNNFAPSIISSNCVGGIISHELGLQFKSPFVNLFIKPCDFVKFLSDPEKYLLSEVHEDVSEGKEYPVASILDIKLYCVHYNSFEEFCEKWEKRKKRIDWSNVYVIMTERDGCTIQDLENFDKLPYKNKVVFTTEEHDRFNSSLYLEGTCTNDTTGYHNVEDLTKYPSKFSGKRLVDKFDYVEFLNR